MNQEVNNDVHSLSHTKWNCKYHIVFAPPGTAERCFTAQKADVKTTL